METATCPTCGRELKPYRSKDGVWKFRRHKNGDAWCTRELVNDPKTLVEVLDEEETDELFTEPKEPDKPVAAMAEPDPLIDCPNCETRLAHTMKGDKICWMCGFREDAESTDIIVEGKIYG